MTTNKDDTKKEGFGITLKFSNNNRFYYGSMYDKDHIVETNEMITVEKEVYEAVLRNSLRVNDLEEENIKFKNLLKEIRGKLHYINTPKNQHNVFGNTIMTKIDEVLK